MEIWSCISIDYKLAFVKVMQKCVTSPHYIKESFKTGIIIMVMS